MGLERCCRRRLEETSGDLESRATAIEECVLTSRVLRQVVHGREAGASRPRPEIDNVVETVHFGEHRAHLGERASSSREVERHVIAQVGVTILRDVQVRGAAEIGALGGEEGKQLFEGTNLFPQRDRPVDDFLESKSGRARRECSTERSSQTQKTRCTTACCWAMETSTTEVKVMKGLTLPNHRTD